MIVSIITFILVEMRITINLKRCILLIITVVIVIGSFYFDVKKTNEIVNDISYISNFSSDEYDIPLRGNISANRITPIIAVEAEVKNTELIRESLNRAKSSSTKKRILVFTLILLLCISFGVLFLNALTSIFPWTDIISSRRSIISYIHMQDGAK